MFGTDHRPKKKSKEGVGGGGLWWFFVIAFELGVDFDRVEAAACRRHDHRNR